MILLKNKQDCCGCSACQQRCPKQCITMQEDKEGFLYPHINSELCIDCGICEKVCPVINQEKPREPINVYAAKNQNEQIRMQSSSGGIFSMIAERVIIEGGVIFGARWNPEWEVVHDYTENTENLSAFRSSKYLQSKIGNTFKQAELFLKQGRIVLFTGTPCQIAGLKKFLRKEYDNLLTVEVFCHSVPSPQIWKIYLNELLHNIKWKKNDIVSINFRYKEISWKNYHFFMLNKNGNIFKESSYKNLFIQGFLKDLYTRPSCNSCPAKCLKSGSDISIGDYWGIQSIMPEIDDDKGISAVIVNTHKGQEFLEKIEVEHYLMDYKNLCKYNPAIIKSLSYNQNLRNKFYDNKDIPFFIRINHLCRVSIISKIRSKVIFIINNLLCKK